MSLTRKGPGSTISLNAGDVKPQNAIDGVNYYFTEDSTTGVDYESIGTWTSTNGIDGNSSDGQWAWLGTAFSESPGQWDDNNTFCPSVINLPNTVSLGGPWACYYSASYAGAPNFAVGVAFSPNMQPGSWTKWTSNPIFTGSNDADPAVVEISPGSYIMYLTQFYPAGQQILYSTSSDGLTWSGYGIAIFPAVMGDPDYGQHGIIEPVAFKNKFCFWEMMYDTVDAHNVLGYGFNNGIMVYAISSTPTGPFTRDTATPPPLPMAASFQLGQAHLVEQNGFLYIFMDSFPNFPYNFAYGENALSNWCDYTHERSPRAKQHKGGRIYARRSVHKGDELAHRLAKITGAFDRRSLGIVSRRTFFGLSTSAAVIIPGSVANAWYPHRTIGGGGGTTFLITVSAAPMAAGSVTGGGTFSSGSMQTVVATVNSGYSFVNWTDSSITTTVVDSTGAVWSLGDSYDGTNAQIWRNGWWYAGGFGTELALSGGNIYSLNNAGQWQNVVSGVWTNTTMPGGITQTLLINASQVSASTSYTFTLTRNITLVANFTGPHAWPASAGTTPVFLANAPLGSDSNNGTSNTTPWLTLAKVQASAPTNSTINVRGGDRFQFAPGAALALPTGAVIQSTGWSNNWRNLLQEIWPNPSSTAMIAGNG